MTEPRSDLVHVHVDASPCLNLALARAGAPLVERITLRHDGDEPLDGLRLRVRLADGPVAPFERDVPALEPGASWRLETPELLVDMDAVGQLDAARELVLEVELFDAGGVLGRASTPLVWTPRGRWPGLAGLPETLAAWIRPGDPALVGLVDAQAQSASDASEGLRVQTVVDAAWHALAGRALTLSALPDGWATTGLDVSVPEALLARGHGTVLDAALLLAGLFERAGLAAVLVLADTRVLVGCRTQAADTHGLAFDDEGSVWLRRAQRGELLLVDPARLAEPGADLAAARRGADEVLRDVDALLGVLDVTSARHHVAPLWDRAAPGAEPAAQPAPVAAPEPEPAPRHDEVDQRLARWKRRLLDLSLRNRLLNVRETRKTLPLQVHDLGELEDVLADGRALSLRPRLEVEAPVEPEPPVEADGPVIADDGDAEPAPSAPVDTPSDPPAETQSTLAFDESGRIYEKPVDEPGSTEDAPGATDTAPLGAPEPAVDPLHAALAASLGNRRLHAPVSDTELDKRLLELSRAARLSLEETGANTLSLVLGFLAWREHDDDTVRRAPILLLPLHIEREGRAGFRIRQADEDPRLNVTLLEKLRAEHGLELPITELPEDETGVDVHGVLDAVREAIAEQDGWEVVEEAWLGLFSFTKFMMWRDLEDRSAVLLDHDVVRHLVQRPDDAFQADGGFPDPDRLDDERHPREVLCPLDADSSQLAAVLAAQEGCSFRLEGPPGTGKSQTITNLIAQCLAQGQRVLFVAEKRAALEVVHARLAQVGLGPFCLELHSNKTSKRAVLDQLREALEVARRETPETWESHAERVAELRTELNAYADVLHRPGSFGLSVRDATAHLARLHDVPRRDLGKLDVDAVDEDRLVQLEELLDRLQTARGLIGDPLAHDLAGFARARWETSLAERLRQCCVAAREALDARDAALGPVLGTLGLDAAFAETASRAELACVARLAGALGRAPAVGPELLGEGRWQARRTELSAWLDGTDDVQRRLTKLQERWDERLLERDLDGLLGRWRRAAGSFVLVRWWSQRGLRRELADVWRAGGAAGGARLGDDLDLARRLREDRQALQRGRDAAAASLLLPAAGELVDVEASRAALAWGDELHGLLLELSGEDVERLQALRQRLTRLVTEQRDGLVGAGGVGGVGAALQALVGAQQTLDDRVQQLLSLADAEARDVLGGDAEPGCTGRLAARLDAWERGRDALRDWCHWRGLRDEAVHAGLRALVMGFEAGELPDGRLVDVFRRSLFETWLESRIDEDARLRSFRGSEHERKMRRFARLDRELMSLASEHMQATLAARVPETSDVTSPHSELGLLERELRKKRRHLPVRRLFERLPHLLPRLKPCVLMSPLSAAQYLDANEAAFDVVVFDEASQIPVWDAVGAIARGKQVVVVGDSRQLPPTSFFQKLEDEDDVLDDEYEELESLLDECAAAGLPHLDLRWHYRSRHESLIAFSNAHYYNNQLVTFPSPHDRRDGLGVSLVRVDGTYDKGRSRTNRAEAEALVADITRRLTGPDGERSLGVVTFSLAQQQLVEELLEEARRGNAELDARLDAGLDEAVFIKNLENVQGDERDVILLAVGYGPDARGKLSMNFGPLNRDGGERRLNVAVTRAREELVVFASFDPEAIDLARTRAEGVRHLKTFLEYAARGPAALGERLGGDEDVVRREAPLAEAVAERLAERGLDVARDVGCSASRVDLAVGDGASGSRLGVLLDGAGWAGASTARDRDRLRPEVLSRLGWRLHRLWSAEWWLQPERELERLLAAWEAARDDKPPEDEPDDDDRGDDDPDDAPRGSGDDAAQSDAAAEPSSVTTPVADGDAEPGDDGAEPERADAAPTSTPDDDDGDDVALLEGRLGRVGDADLALPSEPDRETESSAPTSAATVTPAAPDAGSSTGDDDAEPGATTDARASATAIAPSTGVSAQPWKPAADRTRATPESFHEPRGRKPIERRLLAVLEAEGPLGVDTFVRRVAEGFEIERVTSKVRERVRAVWQELDDDVRPVEREGFLWPAGLEPETWRAYRPAGDGERRLEDVCDEELANAAQDVLADNISLPAEALAREVARLFGVQRVGASAVEQALRGVQAVVARGDAVADGESVRVP